MERQPQARRRRHSRARICPCPGEGERQGLVPDVGVSNLLVALNLLFVFLARLFDLVFHTIQCLGVTGIDFLFGVLLLCSCE